MRRTFPSCSGSAPMSIRVRPSATRVTPARQIGRRRVHAASSRSSRTRPTRRARRASSQRPSTEGALVSSRPSESSSVSSASPYDAKRRSGTSHPSSHSRQVSSWSNPSTPPSTAMMDQCDPDRRPLQICKVGVKRRPTGPCSLLFSAGRSGVPRTPTAQTDRRKVNSCIA